MNGFCGQPTPQTREFLARFSSLLGWRGVARVQGNTADVFRQMEMGGDFEYAIFHREGWLWRLHSSETLTPEAYHQEVGYLAKRANPNDLIYAGSGGYDLRQALQAIQDELSGVARKRRQEEVRRRFVQELLEAHKKPKVTRGQVTVPYNDGSQETKPAELVGGWAVIREVDVHDKPCWNLTHVPSGLKVGTFEARWLARQMASVLTERAPWLNERGPASDVEGNDVLVTFALLGRTWALPYAAGERAGVLLRTGRWPETVLGPDPAAEVT